MSLPGTIVVFSGRDFRLNDGAGDIGKAGCTLDGGATCRELPLPGDIGRGAAIPPQRLSAIFAGPAPAIPKAANYTERGVTLDKIDPEVRPMKP